MKPILIHVHAFYTELLPEIEKAIKSFEPYPHEVWVTYVEDNQEMAKALSHFERVIPVPNRGYDVGPFVKVLNSVDLSKYSYIAKLHTKRDLKKGTFLKNVPVSGPLWRNYLLSYSKPKNLAACIAAFEADPTLGMVGHHALIHNTDPGDEDAWEGGVELLHRCNLEERNSHYICGTMFMCRAELMQPIKELLANEEFEIPTRKVPYSISHAVERLLGMCVTAQGYEIKDVYTSGKDRWLLRLKCFLLPLPYKILRFLYQNKETINGSRIVKIVKIPVYYSKNTDTEEQP